MFITHKVCVLGVGGNRVGTNALKGLAHLCFLLSALTSICTAKNYKS